MTLLVGVIWLIIGFFVLRYVGSRYLFHEPRRADVAATAVVVAFVLGFYWPLAEHRAPSPATSSPDSPADNAPLPARAGPPGPSAPPPSGRNVTGDCRGGATTPQASALGFFDLLSEVQAAKVAGLPVAAGTGEVLVARGWGAPQQHAAKAVCLIVDGRLERRAISFYGSPRPDVAAATRDPALATTGFTIWLPRSALAAGSHRLQAAAEAPDGSLRLLRGSWTISASGAIAAER